jgi:hypothetical protein
MKLPIIINEAGKIYIEAVPQLAWGKGKECTFIGALEAALSVSATPHTYENMMGWSGLAFRVRWYHGDTGRRWCPSSPVGESPEEVDLLRKAIGWELPIESWIDEPHPAMADYAATIAQEIRAGRPVLTYEPQLNVAAVFGFENEGRILLLRDYMSDEPQSRIPIDKIGPFLCFLGNHTEALHPHEAFVRGINQGVENWHRSHAPTKAGRYWLGRAALLKWREDLQNSDSMDTELRKLLFFVSWWAFDSLADSRTAADRFLRRNAEYFHGSQHSHLLQAAELYNEEARMLRSTLADKQAFLGPWTGKAFEHWSPATRLREIGVLNQVLALETEAVGQLENMLDAAAAPLSSASGSLAS